MIAMSGSDDISSSYDRRAKLTRIWTWRALAVLALLPALIVSFWVYAIGLFVVDPTAALPPGASHSAIANMPIPIRITVGFVFAAYWLAYWLLHLRHPLFLLLYPVAVALRLLAWIMMVVNPSFPTFLGFVVLGIDSAVIVLAFSWHAAGASNSSPK